MGSFLLDRTSKTIREGNPSMRYALRLLRRGISIIPVPPDATHDGKRPAMAWAEYQRRLPTEDEIRRWFAVPMNIAIITGAVSGLVVADCDSEDAIRWWVRTKPYIPWQVRTGRGWHLYYGHPGVAARNRTRVHRNSEMAY